MMMSAKKRPVKKKKSRSRSIVASIGLVLLVSISMSLIGLSSYVVARELTFTRNRPIVSTPRPAFVPQESTQTVESQGQITETIEILREDLPLPTQQIAALVESTLTPWDGKERVTVLIMGVDYRDWAAGEGAARSDTMMLVSLDPVTKTAGMLSVPRDLWVAIPGFTHGKINTAHALGDAYNLPGGGPALAVRTVELVIGIPIHYYAVVDFGAFVRFIDELGGVKLDIPYAIEIDPLNDENKNLKPGVQTLPGDLALAYARNRSTGDGDFDRARRQQQVILGIRDRILDYEMLPTLIEKAPALYRELVTGVRTNMQLDEIIKLAVLASQVPDEGIRSGVIDINYVAYGWSPDELSILVPYPDRIRVLRDEIFATSGSIAPLAPGTELERMVLEGATIAVKNGSNNPDLARQTANYLTSQGATVKEVLDAGDRYIATTIIDHSGRPYTMQYLVDLMRIAQRQIAFEFNPGSHVDIELILGDDWAANNVLSNQ